MNELMLLLGAAGLAAPPVLVPAPAPAPPLSEPTRTDLRCFMLYAIAVAGADAAKDAKATESGSLGLMYFYGKLRVEAPGLSLADAIRREADPMAADPKIKEVGKACDAEFEQRGKELIDLGKVLQEVGPQVASSS